MSNDPESSKYMPDMEESAQSNEEKYVIMYYIATISLSQNSQKKHDFT